MISRFFMWALLLSIEESNEILDYHSNPLIFEVFQRVSKHSLAQKTSTSDPV